MIAQPKDSRYIPVTVWVKQQLRHRVNSTDRQDTYRRVRRWSIWVQAGQTLGNATRKNSRLLHSQVLQVTVAPLAKEYFPFRVHFRGRLHAPAMACPLLPACLPSLPDGYRLGKSGGHWSGRSEGGRSSAAVAQADADFRSAGVSSCARTGEQATMGTTTACPGNGFGMLAAAAAWPGRGDISTKNQVRVSNGDSFRSTLPRRQAGA